MKTWLHKYYPLGLTLCLASALRIRLLSLRGTFWFDEMFSIHFSSLPWTETIKYAIIETNPPLFTLFMRGWLFLINSLEEWLVRLPSLFFGLATIALIYWFAYKVFNRKAGIISALLLSVADLHVFLNTEGRVYSLMIFLSLLSFVLFWQIFFNNRDNKWWWAAYLITNLLLLFSHLTAIAIPLTQALTTVLVKNERKQVTQWWTGHIVIGIVWLAWFIPSIISKIDSRSLTAWYFDPATSEKANWLSVVVSLFLTRHQPNIFTIISLVIIIGLGWITVKAIREKEGNFKNLLIMLLMWAGLLILTGSVVGVYVSKYYVSASLALYLLAGYGISQLTKNTKTFGFSIFIILILILPSSYGVANHHVFSWHKLTKEIKNNETDTSLTIVIPFNESLPLRHYYKGNRPIKGVYIYEDDMPFEERVVRFNWNKQVTKKEKLEEWLDKNITEADKLFYLQYTNEYDWTHQILMDKGWTVEKATRPDGYINLYLFEFHAPGYDKTTSEAKN